MDQYAVYPNLGMNYGNNYPFYGYGAMPSSKISVAVPYTDELFGKSYIQGPQIDVDPFMYSKRGNMRNPNMGVGFGVAPGQIQLFDMMNHISNKKGLKDILNGDITLSPDYSAHPLDQYSSLTQSYLSPQVVPPMNTISPLSSLTVLSPLSPLSPLSAQFAPSEYKPISFNPIVNTPNAGNSSNTQYSMVLNPATNQYEFADNNNGNITYYTGSGVMIFDNYLNSRGRNERAVVLFRNSRTGLYEELGGSVDKNDFDNQNTLAKTAMREAREESANLFTITNPNSLLFTQNNNGQFVNRQINSRVYRCYGICVSSPSNNAWQYMYQQNLNKLRGVSAQHQWLETDDMQRFYIRDILYGLSSASQGNMGCLDAEGYQRIIAGRTKACLRLLLTGYGYNSVADMCFNAPKQGTVTTVNDPQMSFLNGTTTVTIN